MSAAPPIRLHRPQLSSVIVMAATAGLIAWLVIGNVHHPPLVKPVAPLAVTPSASSTRARSLLIRPVVLTAARLKARVRALGQPVYWVGPAHGRGYELSRSESGSVFVRYLPPGVNAGDHSRAFVTVGTVPFPNAFASSRLFSRQAGVRWARVAGGGLASYRQKQPDIVYLTYPGLPYKLELFDPNPAEGRSLVASGQVGLVR